MIDRCYLEITNSCNLSCAFCPKYSRKRRMLTLQEFEHLTDKLQGRVHFLYFHLMGEPMLHPLLPQFIECARNKGFFTILTTNGTQLQRADEMLNALPHKIQLSLHSHEGNGRNNLEEYVQQVMQFAVEAADRGTCIVLRLWNQGGLDSENQQLEQLLEQYTPRPWVQRPDGYRLRPNIYLEFSRKFEWPDAEKQATAKESFCKALIKQIGVLVDGSLVPCCLDCEGKVVLGNLFTQSLDEILSSPRARALVDGFAQHRAVESLCQNCESASVSKSFRGNSRKSDNKH